MNAAPISDVPLLDGGLDVPADTLCAACGHPASGHDAVAVRYCAVTIAAGSTAAESSRGCLCRGLTSTGQAPLSTTGRFR